MVSCSGTDNFFPGKIAVVTGSVSSNLDRFYSANQLVKKYGADKILHITWPDNPLDRQAEIIEILSRLAMDREIKVLIINTVLKGTNAAVDKIKKTRKDIFIIYCSILHEPIGDSAARADLLLMADELGMAQVMVNQAKKQGAGVFVHYSFPRHMSMTILSNRRDLIRDTCAAEGIQFVEATVPDPLEEDGLAVIREYIRNSVSELVAKYGNDTAFFSSNCSHQAPLIKAIVDCHAIYPQPCCPSPYHGFPEALGIKTNETMDDLVYVITEASRIAAEKNMTDRLSTWPVSSAMMFTNVGAEYAIKWLNGEVPKAAIDDSVLEKCMSTYVKETVGEAIEISITPYSDNEKGVTYDHFKLLLMSYLDF